jgi:hypothetical protein
VIVPLLNRGQREGVFETDTVVVEPTVQTVHVQFDPHPNEMTTTKEVKVDFFVSADAGQTWYSALAFTAKGPWSGRPSITFDPQPFHGMTAKAIVTVSERMNCGVLLYVNEEPPE